MVTVIRSGATIQPTSRKGGRRRASAACRLALTNELSSCIVAPGTGTARELLVPWKMRTPETSAKATIIAIAFRFMPLANDETERCGRPTTFATASEVDRPHSLH